MITNLQAAKEFVDGAAQLFDRAGGSGSEQMLETARRRGHENVQLAIAAAAIAQAEAAERQAQAMERIAAMLESTLSPAQSFGRRFVGVEVLDKAF